MFRHNRPNLNVSIVLQTLFTNKIHVKSVLKLCVKCAKLLDILKRCVLLFSGGTLVVGFRHGTVSLRQHIFLQVFCPFFFLSMLCFVMYNVGLMVQLPDVSE